MKKRIIIGAFVTICILAFTYILSKTPFSQLWNTITTSDPKHLIIFIIVSILLALVHPARWTIVLRTFGIKIGFWRTFSYYLVGAGISFITPGPKLGGEPARGYLISKHGIRFSKALSTVVIDKTTELSSFGVMFVVCCFLAITKLALPQQTEYIMIAVAVLFTFLVAMFYYRMLSGKHFFLHIIKRLGLKNYSFIEKVEHFEKYLIEFYKRNKGRFFLAVLISMAAWFFAFAEYKYGLLMLGIDATILQIFVMYSFVGLAYLLPAPGGIGTLEAGQVSVFSLLKLHSTIGVGFALLIKARDSVVALAGLIIAFFYGINIKKFTKEVLEKSTK